MGATLDVTFARAGRKDWPGMLPRLALVVGTEGAGLTPTPETEAAADYRVRIPIAGAVDSLNLAVAAGIALHAIRN